MRVFVFCSDRIMCIDGGEVADFDTPSTLLGDEFSIYSQLCREAGTQQDEGYAETEETSDIHLLEVPRILVASDSESLPSSSPPPSISILK